MDLSKAFDCIPHDLLIAKLHAYGFSFETLTFLNSYLRNRKQCVKINNICSDFLKILSGVPQGSILGPILFNIFLRPISDDVLCWGVPAFFYIARLRSTYKTIFRCARTIRAGRLRKACCTAQHGFSTASKMKRHSADLIFLCKLEKFEK